MKTSGCAALAAIGALAAAAPAHAGKGDLANEVTLHIETVAAVAPDRAELSIALQGSGATRNDALADLKAKQAKLAKGMADAGIAGASVVTGQPAPVENRDEVVVDVAVADAALDACRAAADAAADVAPAPSRKGARKKPDPCMPETPAFTYTATSTVTFTDLTQLDKAQSAAGSVGWPSYRFGNGLRYTSTDPAGAAKKARETAVRQARSEADAYAAALGYHVVRIARVSNAGTPFGMHDLHNLASYADVTNNRMTPSYFGAAAYVTVGIDYVIAPN